MSSQYGQLFRISTWGESHGGGVGVVIDGCPPRIRTQRGRHPARPRPAPAGAERDRHAARRGADRCEILSGVFEGKTTRHAHRHPGDEQGRSAPRPTRRWRRSSGPRTPTITYQAKYGIRNWQGGGRASARETIGRVAAAAVAKKVLATLFPSLEIVAYVKSIHEITAQVDPETVKFEAGRGNIVRCPDPVAAENMIELIKKMRSEGDSVGGVIECVDPRRARGPRRAGL